MCSEAFDTIAETHAPTNPLPCGDGELRRSRANVQAASSLRPAAGDDGAAAVCSCYSSALAKRSSVRSLVLKKVLRERN
jgi:hypothetical protein